MSRSRFAVLACLLLVLGACERGGAPTTTPVDSSPPETATATTEDPGVMTGLGVEDDTIRLGMLATLSGPVAESGRSLAAGHRVYWDYANEDLGGVGGRFRVELVERDNAYDAERNRTAFEEMSGEILAVSSTLGSPMTASIFRTASESDILVAAGSQASFWSRAPNVVLNLGESTFRTQFANGAYWAAEEADPPLITADTDVGIIYQDDDYGEDCLAGYELALAELGFRDTLRHAFPFGETDLGSLMVSFRDAGVEVIFFCGLPSSLGRVVTADLVIGYSPVLLGSSASYLSVLPFVLGGEDGESAGLAVLSGYHQLGTGPAYEDDSPGMKLLRQNLERYGADLPEHRINSSLYFGYTQAATVHAVLERAFELGDLTRSGVLEAVDRLGEVDLGFGFGPSSLGPDPEDRIPTHVSAVGRPTPISEAKFGLERISDWLTAPYLDESGSG